MLRDLDDSSCADIEWRGHIELAMDHHDRPHGMMLTDTAQLADDITRLLDGASAGRGR